MSIVVFNYSNSIFNYEDTNLMVDIIGYIGGAVTASIMIPQVVKTYEKKGNGISDAILNARLVRILREGDYDYTTGEVKLWNPTF